MMNPNTGENQKQLCMRKQNLCSITCKQGVLCIVILQDIKGEYRFSVSSTINISTAQLDFQPGATEYALHQEDKRFNCA